MESRPPTGTPASEQMITAIHEHQQGHTGPRLIGSEIGPNLVPFASEIPETWDPRHLVVKQYTDAAQSRCTQGAMK
jgi:hypothetical protein